MAAVCAARRSSAAVPPGGTRITRGPIRRSRVGGIRALQDKELLAQAREWRLWALRGEKGARGSAHELECEVRQRFPTNDKPQALPPMRLLSAVPQPTRRRWKPW